MCCYIGVAQVEKIRICSHIVGKSGTAADRWPGRGGHGSIRSASTKKVEVSTADLISVSDTANTAFGGFDWTEHEGKGVRLFVQGFG